MKYAVLNTNNLFLRQEFTFLVFIFGILINVDSGLLWVYTMVFSMHYKRCKEMG